MVTMRGTRVGLWWGSGHDCGPTYILGLTHNFVVTRTPRGSESL